MASTGRGADESQKSEGGGSPRLPPVWDIHEPFLRFATHLETVAEAATRLCGSLAARDLRLGQELFVQEWPNLKRAWEWSRDRMADDGRAAQLCADYLSKTMPMIRRPTTSAELTPLVEA